MKVMVTGCAGFIGSHITDQLLKEGHEVIGIDCFTDYYAKELKEQNISGALKNTKFRLINKDIIEMSNYPDVDIVFHQAAQAGVRSSWGKDFSIYSRYNIEATQNLLEFYKDKNLKKFVYASSSSVYGDVSLPMHEELRLQPVSPYGVSKLAAEHLCYLYWKNYKVPTISLRYFTVYGPRQRPDMGIHKFVHANIQGKTINIYGDGTQTRDFTYVDDVVRANILAAMSDLSGQVYNIGGGTRINVNNLIALIERETGKKAIIEYSEKQKGDVTDTLADNTKAKKELGWNPVVDITDGISRYVSWINRGNRSDVFHS
ncbi:NAD-dependent epimerase/dehydratase family protein [Methanospirillum sp.]